MIEYKENKKTTLTVLLCVSILHIIILFIICFLGSKISSYNLNSKEDNIYVDFAVVQEQTIPTEPLVPLLNESNTVEQEPDPVEPLPIEPEPEPECNPDDHIRDNDHRCTDHDDQYQSADDRDRTSDPAGIYGTDFCNRKTLTEILQKPAGISGTYQWSGRRSIWRT